MIRPILFAALMLGGAPALAFDPSNPGGAPLSPSMDRATQPSRAPVPSSAPTTGPEDRDAPTVNATQTGDVAGPPLPNGTPVAPDGKRAVPPKE